MRFVMIEMSLLLQLINLYRIVIEYKIGAFTIHIVI